MTGKYVYFHTAAEGMKLEYIAANRQVCFEVEDAARVVPIAEQACKWSASYYSVIGFGTVEEILDPERKSYSLNCIMRHYSGREWKLDEEQLQKARVWRIAIERITGKQSKDKIPA
jgi:nitroimidazol reductase NimA-like FMN-containing flavoprotein (pyridoxamine 5'-phosphate oxidase superfamily)